MNPIQAAQDLSERVRQMQEEEAALAQKEVDLLMKIAQATPALFDALDLEELRIPGERGGLYKILSQRVEVDERHLPGDTRLQDRVEVLTHHRALLLKPRTGQISVLDRHRGKTFGRPNYKGPAADFEFAQPLSGEVEPMNPATDSIVDYGASERGAAPIPVRYRFLADYDVSAGLDALIAAVEGARQTVAEQEDQMAKRRARLEDRTRRLEALMSETPTPAVDQPRTGLAHR
jgi:hypothetical protein